MLLYGRRQLVGTLRTDEQARAFPQTERDATIAADVVRPAGTAKVHTPPTGVQDP